MTQKITHSPVLRSYSAKILAFYLKIVHATCRANTHNVQAIAPYWEKKKPIIVVFWHNRMALAPFAWQTKNPFFMMISEHPDGKMISQVVWHFGIKTLTIPHDMHQRALSFKHALKHLKQGSSLGITPDGPQGPCYHATKGVFLTALASGCDVIGLTYATSRHRRFPSWDRFFLPLPFGTGHLIWSDPVPAPKDKSEQDDFLKTLTNHLNDITTRAHEYCGIKPDIPTEISQPHPPL